MTKARASSAGYSGTPLAKKLGIGEGSRVWLVNAPANYRAMVAPLPGGVAFASRPSRDTDIAHVFSSERRDLDKVLRAARAKLGPETAIWVSWPKKSAAKKAGAGKASGVATDLTEDTIREVALPLGFVDIKVCAVDETWSGLKLVVRKALR